ncbi:hypothetical protein A4S05_33380 [Nostoc sp. KVJ20]|uniref:WD40 domain-containing protein n=1 Tax=Nostoc sp. KVJ20 TaxID=457944 RepID=UPI00083CAC48|nr:caspase family protein [Nostoc sp. KVJ20]ODH00372.1 hypothetical protein A4S05_33380 [Nostoc sp. KVJ20]
MSRDALVVGINQYNFSRLSALRSPAIDAEAIAKRLSEAGNFHVKRLPQLLDPFEDNAPRISPHQEVKLTDLKDALEELFYPEGQSIPDTALFYFSGHGLRTGRRIKEGFLATSDTNPDVGNWGLSLKWLRELLQESPVRQQIIWLDCCFSGELLNFTEADPGERGNTRDRCFIAASREFEPAYENVGGANSVLTNAILRGFDLANVSNQWVTNETLVAFLREELKTAPQKFISNNLGCINIIFKTETGNKQAVQPATPTANQPNQTAKLAEQLRAWFTALRYDFEQYEINNETYFEWIINVINPIGRKRYNRILVRGITGEAEMKDVAALRKSVNSQRTDIGWLITNRRVSRAAKDEVSKQENQELFCYTLDELLDRDADFSGYLNWLEDEIKQRGIDRTYVPLACTKEEFDLISKQKMGISCYGETDGWIDGYVDRWLDDPAKEHLSILGEFGTGKTWFGLHYAWTALQRYRDAQHRGVERPRLPLVIPLRDYAKAVSVESLFSEFFFRKHEIPLPGYSAFEQLNRMGKVLLIFDGFDEMAARVNRQQMINNFWELAKVVVPGAKVILTCRTEHFPEAKQGRALLSAELQASTINLPLETPRFEVLELEKFDDEQIRQVLAFRTEPETVKRVMNNSTLRDLARRPVMTELIIEALPEIEAGKPVDISRVYLYAVRHKMERDIKAERTFTSLADKLYFLCELSWEMLSTDKMSMNYKEFPDRIRHLFGSVVQKQRDLDHWQYDMMGQTMLIRNADGDYTPAHRSFLEFFIAYKLAAELGILNSEFVEIARSQSHLSHESPQDYTWSSYFQRTINHQGEIIPILPLGRFLQEPFEYLSKTIGQLTLTRAIIDLLILMIKPGTETIEVLKNIVFSTKGKNQEEVNFLGGNAATLLLKLDNISLKGCDLQRSVILGADFTNAILQDVDFTNANLENSIFNIGLGKILAVASNFDSSLAATGDDNGDVRLVRFRDGHHISTLKGHKAPVRTVTFNPKGDILASGSEDNTIRLWETATGKLHYALPGHTGWIWSVIFSPDGKTLASSSGDSTVILWDVLSSKQIGVLKGHLGPVRSIVFSSDSKVLASASEDQKIRLWDVNTKKCLCNLSGHNDWVLNVTFSPNDKILASGSTDCTVKLWNVDTGECSKTLQLNKSPVRSITFSPDGKTLACGSEDQQIKLWNVETGESISLEENADRAWVKSVLFSPDGKTLIGQNPILQEAVNQVQSIAFCKNTVLASASRDQTLQLWDVITGECLSVLQGHTDRVLTLAYSPDAEILASGGNDCKIILWDIATGKALHHFLNFNNPVRSIAFSPDGKILASGEDHILHLWTDLKNEPKRLNSLKGHQKWLWSVTFSPDGKILASGSGDRTIRLWNVKTGECEKILSGHTSPVRSISFSPDSKILASGSEDKTLRLWNVKSGRCLKILREHVSWVRTIAFSPDGKFLASGSEDQTLRLWHTSTRKCEKVFSNHTKGIRSIAFSPDGKFLVSGSDDETIKIYHSVETKEVIENKTLRIPRPYEGMNITNIIGLTKIQRATLKAVGAKEDSIL